jgi:hypothetical protein
MGILWHSQKSDLRDPAAVIAFAGWGDAGRAATGVARHLIETYPSKLVAEIPPDEFYDFTVRRPFTYLVGEERRIRWPENQFHVVHHPMRDLVVLLGEEPHLRWQRFTEDVIEALVTLNVGDLVLLGAFLGEVPHTRPTPIFGAGNPLLMHKHQLDSTNYQGPTGIVGVLTTAFSTPKLPVAALWGAVPHYVDNPDYPAGSYALLGKASEVLGIDIAAGDLAARSLELRIAIDGEIADQPELVSHIQRLEADFPEETTQGSLVDEIERYLKERG